MQIDPVGNERPLSDRAQQLSDLLDRWDPVGVYEDPQWPAGEYLDLVHPILTRLDAGIGRDELARDLTYVLTNDYGLGTYSPELDLEPATMIVSWYAALSPE